MIPGRKHTWFILLFYFYDPGEGKASESMAELKCFLKKIDKFNIIGNKIVYIQNHL